MDAFVQCTEQETENHPVHDQRGRKPQVAATRPNQKSGCGQQADVDRELQGAASIRALRESPHGLAVKATYRNCIDIHGLLPHSVGELQHTPRCTHAQRAQFGCTAAQQSGH